MTPLLADAIFWIAVVACLVAQTAILRSTVVARAGYATSPARRPASRVEEIVLAVAPALALAGVLFLTWRTLHPRGVASAPAVVLTALANSGR